ncbi:hypothetical protein D3C73_980750 [compost metagenome]
MVVPVVERDIEDGTLEGDSFLSYVVGAHLCRPQEVDIVQGSRRPVVSPGKGCKALHGHALAVQAIKAFTREGCQPIGQIEVLRVRGLDAAHAQALGIDHFDSAHLGMLFFCRELDQPGFEVRLGGGGKRSRLRIAIDQRLWPCALWRAPHQKQCLQEFPAFTLENFLNFSRQQLKGDMRLRLLPLGRYGLERHCPHGVVANKSQPLQRSYACRVEAAAPEQSVHQQHAPAVRQ